jgi:nitrate/nitrite-specific signal transduction histidine kinase
MRLCSPVFQSSNVMISLVRCLAMVGLKFLSSLLMLLTRTEHLIPMDSRVEIDAKIAAGYFTSGKPITMEDLVKTVGRTWEEMEH